MWILSERGLGVQANNRAEGVACLRVLQHVSGSRDMHAHTVHTQILNGPMTVYCMSRGSPERSAHCAHAAP